ncbi:hypothetical protein [Psilogramma increta granulovirus]|uniref:Uncharacterized protein n=1 Tax=Psilogramma increta granulovirus TaxID=2953508 RepID=A0A977TNQ1_9BBAC|nr:hypothetical protein [Psilogramma increta granulovirus]
MKGCYYFQDTHPLTIYHFGNSNYYFVLRQLAGCFCVNINRVFACINRKHIVNFAQLQLYYPTTSYSLYPSTLMLHMSFLNEFTSKFCTPNQTQLFYEFLKICFLDSNKYLNKHFTFNDKNNEKYDDDLQHIKKENILCLYKILSPQNIRIFLYNNKTYYHATDIARYIKCTPSYCINKFVDDENMVVWYTLKQFLLNNYVCVNLKNYYKNNTIFLKKLGVTQLTMAVCGNNNLLCELEQSTMIEFYKQQQQQQKHHKTIKVISRCCVVNRLTNGLDYLVTIISKNVYFKLRQIIKMYNLRINKLERYHQYLITWQTLKQKLDKKCNINNWKTNLIMVESTGVYEILCDVGLMTEADHFMYDTVNNIKLLIFNGRV